MMRMLKCVILTLVLLLALGSLPVLAQGKVVLNTATLEQLVELKGIGDKTAQKIIDYRNEHQGFSALDELVNVKGIGEKTLESLLPYLILEKPEKTQ
ncbi:MAG: helix-hairpin-helix domain-containing protein [Desulfuromonadales bacterium]|nr:helix-hairpin-helix domain-containing protein [Desulfuromonadales bacterium]MCK4623634.1 helix-hairpin-helix domain-containing protein [Desulfuromonadales bacterium]MCK4690919.1 helix-hairpin-helix domain-containing protein [Desulfuromonadales bacterium]